MNKAFVHGINTGDLAEKIFKEYWAKNFKDPVFMTWDGSSFDAHQHIALIKCVDRLLFDKYL